MKNIIIGIIALVGVFLFIKHCFNPVTGTWVAEAEQRVELVLEGIFEGVPKDSNEHLRAVTQYWRGSWDLKEPAEWDMAKSNFSLWRRMGGIDRPISEFKITGSELINEKGSVTVLVSVKVDGEKMTIQVQRYVPMEWVY